MSSQVAERIIAAAARCFAGRGYARTSLRDIAREAGVALSQLHYYFGSKRELVAAVSRACWQSYIDELERRLQAIPDGCPEAVSAALAAVYDSVRADPASFRLCLELRLVASADPGAAQAAHEVHRQLVDLLSRHLRRLGVTAARARTAARCVLAALDGLVLQALVEDGELDLAEAFRMVGDWLHATTGIRGD